MSDAFVDLAGAPGLLVICDHAANAVPNDIDLGIAPDLLGRHIAWDIGAEPVARALCGQFGCPGLFGTVSRLVIDLHRAEDSPALIPATSDGHPIPGNAGLDPAAREDRLERFYRPYHARLAALVAETAPALIVSIHSFTPALETAPGAERPWHVGILYNQDDRAARIAIDALRAAGFTTGDNEPYSGRQLNATLDRHAERHGIPYLAIEVRNDLIADAAGAARWTAHLAPVIERCRNETTR